MHYCEVLVLHVTLGLEAHRDREEPILDYHSASPLLP